MKSSAGPFLLALVVITAALLWIPPLDSSLWLDELDTAFTVKDGVLTAISRNLHAHPQCSTLYNAIVAAVVAAFGSSEVALRVPSVLATIVALVFLFRIGARLVDRETGLLACLLFLGLRDVVFAAVDARSYAFATAACIASTHYFIRLVGVPGVAPTEEAALEAPVESRTRIAIAYALTAAATVHFQYLFGLTLLAHASVLAFLIVRHELLAAPRDLAIAAACFVAACIPAIAPVLATVGARQALSYAPPQILVDLLAVWVRPEIVASVVPLALLATVLGRRVTLELPRLAPAAWVLLAAWTVLPPVLVFAVSELSTVRMFLVRYFLCAEAGLALVVAVIVRGLEPSSLRSASAVVYALITVLAYSRGHHVLEDWRGMSAKLGAEIDAATPVLLNPGFVEAGDVEWLALPPDDDRREFLAAPASYYALSGPVSLLPYRLDEHTRAYLEREIVPVVESVERFVCVWRQRRDPWVKPWFDGRFGPAGYVARELHSSQALNAVIYERAPL